MNEKWESKTEIYNEPCKKCGSRNQLLFIDNNGEMIYCQNCKNCEDIYRTEEAKRNDAIRAQQENLIVECPYCHSTDTKKISGLSKAGSVAMFGIFAAGKVSKQWHCNNCKSDF